MRFSSLLERKNDTVFTLSGGMKRKLELSRAIMHAPSLLLMDEPTVGLDIQSSRAFWSLLFNYKKKKKISILFSTHKIEEAKICDRVFIIVLGKIIAIKTPQEIEQMNFSDRIKLYIKEDIILSQIAVFVNILKKNISQISISQSGREVVIESQDGHLIISKIFNYLPRGSIKEVSIKRPSIEEGYIRLITQYLKCIQ